MVNLGQVYNARDALVKLVSQPMPIQTAYQLSKVAQKFNQEYIKIEEERQTLVLKHGKENDQGNTQVFPDKVDEFKKEFDEILQRECQTEFDKISVASLPDSISMTAQELALIDFLLE